MLEHGISFRTPYVSNGAINLKKLHEVIKDQLPKKVYGMHTEKLFQQ